MTHTAVEKRIKIAILCALSITFFLLDTVLPKPIPFLKYGVANMLPLVLIFNREYKTAAGVMLFKIVIGNLITAKLLSPIFLLSLIGGMGALTVMFFAEILLRRGISIYGLGLLGAFGHIFFQLLAVKWLIIQGINIYFFYKLFFIPTFISAIIISYLARWLNETELAKL